MTPEELAEIRADLAKISPGPWVYNSYNRVVSAPLLDEYNKIEATIPEVATEEEWEVLDNFEYEVASVPPIAGDTATGLHAKDAQFIAKAPSRISALLEEVARLQSERDEFCQMARALVVKLGGEAAITRKMQNEAREDSDLVWFRPDPLRESITVQLRKRPAPPSIEKETNDGAS